MRIPLEVGTVSTRAGIALVAATLAAVLAVAWFTSRHGSVQNGSVDEVERAQSPIVAVPVLIAEPEELAASIRSPPSRGELEPTAEVASAPTGLEILLDPTKTPPQPDDAWIEGRIEFPAGTPDEERQHVRVQVTVPRLSNNLMDVDLGGYPVDAAGRFRIRVPSRFWWTVELDLIGRFLALDRVRTVEVRALPPDLVLGPELRAVVRIRFMPDATLLARGFDRSRTWSTAYQVGNSFEQQLRRRPPVVREPSGTVEIGALRTGVAHRIRAGAEGALPVEIDLAPLGSAELRELEIALAAAPRIVGFVRDEDGRPVDGASLRFGPDPSRFDAGYAASGADGAFVLNLPADGKVRVHVAREGFLAAELGPWTVGVGSELTDLAVVLSRGATLSGRVEWPDGRPAGGAQVVLVPADRISREQPFPRYDEGTRTRTEPDGSFRIAGLDAVPWALVASASARLHAGDKTSPRVLWTARVPGLRVPDEVVLVLSPGSTVRGRVVDDVGQPVPGAEIVANANTQLHGASGRSVTADASGAFELEALHDGEWRVVARHPGAFFGASEPFVVAAPEVLELVVVASRTAQLAGRVLDPSAVPVGGAEIQLARAEEPTPDSAWNSAGTSAADGTFRIEGLRPGSVRVRARKGGFACSLAVPAALVATEPTEGVDVVLRAGGAVEGRYLAADGTPVPSEELGLFREGVPWPIERARSDEHGRFRFENVEPGALWLGSANGFDPRRDRLVVEDGATVRSDLRLP